MTGPSGAPPRRLLSVAIACLPGSAGLRRTLDSLAVQSLAADAFEVVVLVDPDDDAAVASLRGSAPGHSAPTLRTVLAREVATRGRARNLVMAACAADQLLFVDPGDELSPTCLEVLLEHAAADVVVVAQVADEPLASELAPLAGRRLAVGGHAAVLETATGKLVPTAAARAAGFAEDLLEGEGPVFWFDVSRLARFGLVVADERATYRAAARPGHDRSGYIEGVTQNLDVIARLDGRTTTGLGSAAWHLRRVFTEQHAERLATYLRAHPDDQQRALAEIVERGLVDRIDRSAFLAPARDLAVLYAFLPYADTSALVASRRIRERGVPVDVLACRLGATRKLDAANWGLAAELVVRHTEVPATPTALAWPGLVDFCERGLAEIESWIAEQGPYRSVYSRAMQPGSHLLAALVKLRYPETHWLAEFSDPMLWNPYGEQRPNAADDDALWRTLAAAVEAAGLPLPDDRNVAGLVEVVAYALADEVLFTNENQRDFMLGYADPDAAERAGAKARCEHHPVPPPELYERSPQDYALDADRVNIAYFGAFYATRGLTEVVDGLVSLPREVRDRIAFHVFTSHPAQLAEEVRERGLADVVRINGHVPYLACLNLATRMDALLINDARTAHLFPVNPYLPSKWSDYVGSGTPVWAIVEEGSILSGMDVAHRSVLGDLDGVVSVLTNLAETPREAYAAH